jgi:hypothetical protein
MTHLLLRRIPLVMAILCAMLTVLAQQSSYKHGLDHVAETSITRTALTSNSPIATDGDPCETCLAFAAISASQAPTAWPDLALDVGGSHFVVRITAPVRSLLSSPYAARAPPTFLSDI